MYFLYTKVPGDHIVRRIMKYTYDVIDKQSGKKILCDASAQKVREALGESLRKKNKKRREVW